ncbi:sugar phosphate isomerase/epimerase family protein [Flavilitoribacter nigricans]|uniref:Sugar phosphate isomerase n=1 Tax=Flavilitoribacter nigricans (strain ATCC 23147 / DSM 23189 / NBRC 102662 / NCIMB 1420 / SS-2) TaxID=1122177 RepID=A0A2D0NFP7_FLAN2|nr:sugar phosphate isomerase [Flavilitoribacter nigricans DSM 23189 = NBRC 102662]
MDKLFAGLLILLFAGLIACDNAPQSTEETEDETAEEMDASSAQFGGLALYTLRDTLGKDPKAVLREVAEVGYKYIEAAGYSDGKFYGMAPAEFKSFLDEIGITPLSSHHGDVTLDNADAMIAAVKEAGFKYFVIPVPPMGHFKFDPETRSLSMSEDLEEVMGIINTIAEKCTAAGLECLYHNHNFEFEENAKGIVPIDYFIENSDPEHLNFQMDLYWVTKAGADPIAYFNKAPGRFKSWHVKDMDAEGRFAPVGTGSIDFGKILAQKDKAGMEYYFVEQDMTFNETPMEAIEISHEALKEIGFK